MKVITLTALLVALCIQVESQGILGSIGKGLGSVFGFDIPSDPCQRDALPRFQVALEDFTIRLMKKASFYFNGPFVISPHSIWLSLAAISEFADSTDQKDLFAILNLPEERCVRDKFYQIALSIETSGNDMRFERSRALAIDEQIFVNENWKKFSDKFNYLNYIQVPFEEESFKNVAATMGITTQIAFDGHSIFLDRLDYDSLWTSAFSEGNIERAPFYNELGKEIATVEYMRMKSRVRLAHIPIISAKILELPVGSDGRYTMLLTMGVNNNTVKLIMEMLRSSIIVDIIKALTLSLVPIEVAVPRFSMNTGLDAREILESIGLGKVFSEPDITRHISNPPALPCGYLQKVSINITSQNLGPRKPESTNILSGFLNLASDTATGLASAVGRDFIANKPFIFSLVETKTKVSVFTGVYSPEEAQRSQELRPRSGGLSNVFKSILS